MNFSFTQRNIKADFLKEFFYFDIEFVMLFLVN